MTHTTNPTAEVTFRKSRLKKYGDKVYLKNGQEFEIELFNPLQEEVLAKIKLNGKYISNSGIILRPGQRFFLDRYLDKAEKFLFSTYEVGKSEEVAKAIANNGEIEVTFHKEMSSSGTITTSPWTWNETIVPVVPVVPVAPYFHTSPYFSIGPEDLKPSIFNCSDGNVPLNSCLTSDSIIGFSTLGFAPTFDLNLDLGESSEQKEVEPIKRKKSLKKVTGRVEEGSKSDQEFTYVDKSFQSWSFVNIKYKILPESEKLVEVSEIRIYCTKCGKKAKNGHNFCSSCGNKI